MKSELLINIGYWLNTSNNSFWNQPHVEFTLDLIICLIFINIIVGYLYKQYLYRINWVKYRNDNNKTKNKLNLIDIIALIIVNTITTCFFEFNQKFVENYITQFIQNIFLFSCFMIAMIILLSCLLPNKVGSQISEFLLSNNITKKKKILGIVITLFIGDILIFLISKI